MREIIEREFECVGAGSMNDRAGIARQHQRQGTDRKST
jgi:hypothetical protein